jgi:hypothetical protein
MPGSIPTTEFILIYLFSCNNTQIELFILNIADIHLPPKNMMGWEWEGVYNLKGV